MRLTPAEDLKSSFQHVDQVQRGLHTQRTAQAHVIGDPVTATQYMYD